MSFQEDEVIGVVASALRAMGVPVLAEGGNQMRAFRFMLPTGRRKAPDLVFVFDRVLFVFEAKFRVGYLFTPGSDGLSDHDAMRFVASNAEIQANLLEEARRRLEACGKGRQQVVRVVTGLMAAHPVACKLSAGDDIQVVRVDPKLRSWYLESAAPDASLAELLG